LAVSRIDHIPIPSTSITVPGAATTLVRPSVRGKFIYAGEAKLYIRGVTYGTFRPREDGLEYPEAEVVERDFAQMADSGLNALRTYTVPPRWFLDIARRYGLYVMVGLPIERHVGLLDKKQGLAEAEQIVREGVRACAGHPAILAYTIGNEFQASMVRWYGRRRIERWLERFYRIVKAEDPDGLVTYVNYPTTEYLQLPFLDFACFNVYLETQERLAAYLARLQNMIGDQPLVMSGRIPRRRPWTGWCGLHLPRAVPAFLFMPGPTNGSPGERKFRTGILALLDVTGMQNRRWQQCERH
jgi:hypothetical protein